MTSHSTADRNGSISLPLNEKESYLIQHCADIEDVLAIVFFGRSGSMFLQSLLDSHPQIIMFPGTVLLPFYDQFWQHCKRLPKRDLINLFCIYFAPFFDVNNDAKLGEWKKPAIFINFDKMGEMRDKPLGVDRERFIKVLEHILDNTPITRKFFFQAIHVAYTIALKKSDQLDTSKPPMIVHALHIPQAHIAKKIQSDFSKAKIITMVREPLQTLGSHFKHHMDLNSSLGQALNQSNSAPLIWGPNTCFAIRLEDLHQHPQKTLKRLCSWIGIAWNNCLLQSTFDGLQWWNCSDVEQISGFNTTIISKKHTDIYWWFDKYRLKVLFHKRYKQWGYPSRKVFRIETYLVLPLLLLPFKMEKIFYLDVLHNNFPKDTRNYDKIHLRIAYCIYTYLRLRYNTLKHWRYSIKKTNNEAPLL